MVGSGTGTSCTSSSIHSWQLWSRHLLSLGLCFSSVKTGVNKPSLRRCWKGSMRCWAHGASARHCLFFMMLPVPSRENCHRPVGFFWVPLNSRTVGVDGTPFSDPAHVQMGHRLWLESWVMLMLVRTAGLGLTSRPNYPQKAGLLGVRLSRRRPFFSCQLHISSQELPNPGSLLCQTNVLLISKGGTQLICGPILWFLQIFLFYWHERR